MPQYLGRTKLEFHLQPALTRIYKCRAIENSIVTPTVAVVLPSTYLYYVINTDYLSHQTDLIPLNFGCQQQMAKTTGDGHDIVVQMFNVTVVKGNVPEKNFSTGEGGVFSGHSPLEGNLALFLVQVRHDSINIYLYVHG